MRLIDAIKTTPHTDRKLKLRDEHSIRYIVVHHTAGHEKDVATIARAHMAKGEQGCPYHYVIMPNGWIYKCQPIKAITPHARGGNADGIGIALIGNFMAVQPPAVQLVALGELIELLRANLPKLVAIAHRDVKGSRTACPGDKFPLYFPEAAQFPFWNWKK